MTGQARMNLVLKMRAEPNCRAATSFRNMGKLPEMDYIETTMSILTNRLRLSWAKLGTKLASYAR